MPRWLRWIAFALLGSVGIVVVALVVVYVVVGSHLNRTYRFPDSGVAAADSAALGRGRHLAEVIGKCSGCHGADYGGKVVADNFAFGRLWAANLTAGKGGIGGLTGVDAQCVEVVGARAHGSPFLTAFGATARARRGS